MGAGDLPEFDAWWDYNRPAETEKRFRELLPRARESGDSCYHAQLLTQLARTLGLQQSFEEAHATLDQAAALLDCADRTTRVRYLLERGRVFNSSGNPAKARPLFMEAWELSRDGEGALQNFAIDAAHMMGIIEPLPKQLEWSFKALEIAEPTKSHWRAALYNNIGWTYHDLGEYRKSLEFLEKGLVLREESGKQPALTIARDSVEKLKALLGQV
jgi:tetratricopeptide (TPR) repeat protein